MSSDSISNSEVSTYTITISFEPNKDKAQYNHCKKEFSQKKTSDTSHLH
ncbi:148_t:CDS:2 [Acaulospora morrowiae]|uniref:148_t:CDS:1 n=1 Tax=Acaulospora morrowiae TaxID=94023 RepID=A0A9N8YYK9_9GLOM|nr:148_t:CDS:2 [Acaulospora morrowiae]